MRVRVFGSFTRQKEPVILNLFCLRSEARRLKFERMESEVEPVTPALDEISALRNGVCTLYLKLWRKICGCVGKSCDGNGNRCAADWRRLGYFLANPELV